MKLSYHITFADGSNPYYSFPADAKKQIKEILSWCRDHWNDRYNLYAEGENARYRISNTAWGTWVVYKIGKWVDSIESKQYKKLGNAVKYLEKIMED